MGNNSAIEWTDATWNPVTGCTKVSPGCKYCYAERLSLRLAAMGNPRYRNGFRLSLHRDLLELPLKWRQPRRIFVNSMSDLFHEDIPAEYVKAVFRVMNRASWHNFQILTKRPEHLAKLAGDVTWSPNIWQGVSVESPEYLWRIAHLRQVPARIRFLSLEPLLAAIPQLPLEGMHWVLSLVEKAGRAEGRSRLTGCEASVTSAEAGASRSFLSSGAASTQNPEAACWTAGSGKNGRNPHMHSFSSAQLAESANTRWRFLRKPYGRLSPIRSASN